MLSNFLAETCQVFALRVHIISLRQPATQHQFPRRFDLIHASEFGGDGGVVEQVGLGLGFFRDLDEGVGEGIEGVFVLGLGRLHPWQRYAGWLLRKTNFLYTRFPGVWES